MYNNFLVEKHKKDIEQKSKNDKRLRKWLDRYHSKVQPSLVDEYNQRVNNFITKVEQNPWELDKFEPVDVKEERQTFLMNRIEEMSNKGSKIFKYRDANDFKSNFTESERIERQKNKSLFEKKYGDSDMAYRSIASQSKYDPSKMNEFRSRQKSKEIHDPMRYTSKSQAFYLINQRNRAEQLKRQRRRSSLSKSGKAVNQQNDLQSLRRNTTSCSVSFLGQDEEAKSVQSIRSHSSSSKKSIRENKPFRKHSSRHVSENRGGKIEKSSTEKSYFIGINDIRQSSDDPHTKKLLQNILIKVGKNHSNARDRALTSNTEGLSSEMTV